MKAKRKKKAKGQAFTGPPEIEVTPAMRSQVEALAGFGMPQDHVAELLGMGVDSIQKHFSAEWQRGKHKADAMVVTNLFKIATGSTAQAATAAIFWVKVRMKWHEIQRVIHGFDPSIVVDFVRQVTVLLRKELPEACPHCKTRLDLPVKVARKLRELSEKLADNLKPSEIVPLDKDGLGG